MNKMLVAVLVSASLLSCGAKKEPTTPVNKDKAPTMEHKDDAMGGAGYGGKRADGAAKDPANPCAPK